ncbi:hypothetical protein ACKVWC_011605 [Pyricularia oryzae]
MQDCGCVPRSFNSSPLYHDQPHYLYLYKHPQKLNQRHDSHRLTVRHARDRYVLVMLQVMAHGRAKRRVHQLTPLVNVGQHTLQRQHGRGLKRRARNVLFPLRLEHAKRKARRRARLGIRTLGLGHVQQRPPQAGLGVLQRHEGLALRQEGVAEVVIERRVGALQVQQLDELGDHDGQPAVAPRPQRAGKVVSAVLKGPAVEEEARPRVEQVLEVDEELALGLGDVVRPVEHQADLGQRHHRHHQRVVPQLLVVHVVVCGVLHAAEARAAQVVVRPLCPRLQPGEVDGVARLFVDKGQSQEDGHGVDVFRGAAGGEPVAEPVLDDLETRLISGELVVLPYAVQTDAVRPLPVVPALGIDYAAVLEFEQEFSGRVLDVDHAIDQKPDLGMDVGGLNAVQF